MSARTILLTRPPEDSAEMVEEAVRLGLVPLIEPMLSIEILPVPLPEIEEGAALIFTSAHGVQAFAKKTDRREFIVYAVGKNTEEAAKKAGFEIIHTGGGDAQRLIDSIQGEDKTSLKSPIYIRAEDISTDIAVILGEKGIKVDEFIAYRANSAENLSINLLKMLDHREILAVTFFSQRAAKAFVDLIEQYGRESRMRAIIALCISEAVVKSVSVLPFQKTLVAQTPDRYGMMKLMDIISVSEEK